MGKDRRGNVRLSKSVLEMKFMQRTKNRIRAEQEAEEGRSMYGKDITKGMMDAVDKIVVEPSYAPILDLIVGRVSYGGFNPEIEKFMTREEEDPVADAAAAREMDKDVSDEEFADSLKSTMANKFSRGNKRRKLNEGFMKPDD